MVNAHTHDLKRRRSLPLLASAALIAALVGAFIAPTIASAGTFQGSIVPSPNAMGAAWSIVSSPNTSTTQNNYLQGSSCVSTSDCWAVGYYYTGTYDQTLIEQWNGTSWSIVTSPNATTTENNQLNGVSCVSASDCWAVGHYTYTNGVAQTLIEQWNGTSWSIVTSPNTSTVQGNYPLSVSCVSASDCMAVGYYYTGSGGYYQTLTEGWNGTSWSIVTSPNTSTGENNVLNDVYCVSSSDCWTVGYASNGTVDQTLIEQYNGTNWSIVTSPSTGTNDYLYGVSCVSASDCWAVGSENSSYGTLTEEWNGTNWSIVTSPNATTTEYNQLNGVGCVSSSDCWAVGEYYNGTNYQTLIEQLAPTTQDNYLEGVTCVTASGCWAVGYYYTGTYYQTLIEQWNGTSWSIVTSPNTRTTQSNYLEGVTCVTASDCMAVGYFSNGSYDNLLAEQWNGTSWSIVTSPNPQSVNYYFYGVTCISASDCWAVGYSYNGSNNQTLIEEWNGTSWSLVTSANTSTTQINILYGVSCVSASDCMAAGYYYTGSYGQTLIEQWNGTSWGIVSSSDTSTTENNYLGGVTCVSSADCIAVGWYSTTSYDQTLVEQWNGTSWSIVTSPNASTTQDNYLYGVSCVSVSDCMAVGTYTISSGYEQTLVEEWDGTSWSIVTSPNTSTTQNNQLQGVNCVSSSDCMAVGDYTNSSGTDYQTLIEQFTMACSGGSLSVATPSSATFPDVTLNGSNQTSVTALTFTPDDETGTGNGWNINITSTTLTNGASDTLPTTASTVTAVDSVVAESGNCSLPVNTISPYPITVPAGSTPPTAVPIYSANTGTGEGPSNVTLTFDISVPANAYVGPYTSTWTVTIASGP